jgi:hypothetical protein
MEKREIADYASLHVCEDVLELALMRMDSAANVEECREHVRIILASIKEMTLETAKEALCIFA